MKRLLCAALAVTLLYAAPARAEIFVLANGGRVAGQLLNPDESPRVKYVIKTTAGIELSLDRAQVQKVLQPPSAETEFEKIRPTYPDTPQGQWQLAQWCQSNKLSVQRKEVLQHILQLDPDHAEARRILGYMRVEGTWVTQDELMKSRGYVLYQGHWKSPQEVEVAEAKRKTDIAEKDMIHEIHRYHGWIGTPRDSEGRDKLRAIKDPVAVKGIKLALDRERREDVRGMFVDILAQINSPEARGALVDISLDDPNDEIRQTAVDYLSKQPTIDVVRHYVGQLRVDNKRRDDNKRINRAAYCLGKLGDRSAIRPLIEVLVTTHRFLISAGSAPGSMTTTFGTGGSSGMGGGLTMNQAPKYGLQALNNSDVLGALVALTGVNYDYDVNAWRTWYASQKPKEAVDARRSGPADK